MMMLSKMVTAAALALSVGGMVGAIDSASALPYNGVAGVVATPLAVEHVQYYGYGYGYRHRFFRPYGYGFYGRPFYGRRFYGPGFYGRGFGYRGYRY